MKFVKRVTLILAAVGMLGGMSSVAQAADFTTPVLKPSFNAKKWEGTYVGSNKQTLTFTAKNHVEFSFVLHEPTKKITTQNHVVGKGVYTGEKTKVTFYNQQTGKTVGTATLTFKRGSMDLSSVPSLTGVKKEVVVSYTKKGDFFPN